MPKFAPSLLAALAVLSAPATASAAQLQLWNGSAWVDNGTVHYQGVMQFYYAWQTACTIDLTVVVSAGNASVTDAAFSGGGPCAGMQGQNRPWPIAASAYAGANPPFAGSPTLTPPLTQLRIDATRLIIVAPYNVYCPSTTGTGPIVAVMESGGRLVFSQQLGACKLQTQSAGLLPSVPVRAI